MGRVVSLARTPAEPIADGIGKVPITRGETQEMEAELIRLEPGKRWRARVPSGSDCYLFVLEGAASISAGEVHDRLPAHAFATLGEDAEFSLAGEGKSSAGIVKVLAPPMPKGRRGFAGVIAVIERAKAATFDVPEQKKKRIYFVDHQATRSERGHAMIVLYEKDTVTGLHYHPDAESLFVVLDGALTFTVNGAPATVAPGQAAYFGANDSHGLRVADGFAGASFLEFHIPAAYTTVRQPGAA